MAERVEIDIIANDKTSGVIQGIFQGIGQSIANLALQIPAAVANFASSIVSEATEAQDNLAQLEAVIKSTGGAAGMTADDLTKMADELQKVTRFSDDEIISGQNMLLTFTKIGKDIFPDATKSILNLSTAMKQDLKSSAIQVGKALNDPITGVTALRRVGVQFTDAQEEMIKKMVESGDVMGAQKLILKELETEFGNSAEMAGSTFAGKMDILTHKFDDMKEQVGTALLPVLTEFLDRVIIPLIPYLEQGAEALAGWIGSLAPLAQRAGEIATALADGLLPIFQALADWWSNNGVSITFNATMLFDNIWRGAWQVINTIKAALQPVLDGLAAWWAENGPAVTRIAQTLWTAITDGIARLWEYLRPFIEEQLPKLSAWWEENSPKILEYVQKLADGFAYALPIAIDLIGALLPVLGDLITLILQVGQLSLDVANGNWSDAWNTIQAIALEIINTVQDAVYGLAVWIVKTLGFQENDILKTWSDNWDQFREIVYRIADLVEGRINEMVNNINNALGGGVLGAFAGGGVGAGGMLSGLAFGATGTRAGGGPVTAGQPYLVGERGPELFMPTQSGMIMPNGAGGTINITLQYSPAVSLGSRQEAENTLIPFILNGIRAAQANGYLSVP